MSSSPPPRFRLGDSDPVIATVKSQLERLQIRVGDPASQVFDRTFEYAIRQLQQRRGILCDGVLGTETFEQIELARHRLGDRVLRYDPARLLAGDDVMELQKRLAGLGIYTERIDYFFGSATETALKEAQQELGIVADGVAGPATFQALDDVRRGSDTGNLFALRERVRKSAEGPALSGKIIIIEYATTARDFGETPTPALARREAEIMGDIARRVEGRLTALGAAAILAGPESDIRLADQLSGSLVLSINAEFSPTPAACGVASYFFGHASDRTLQSPIGRLAADLILKEIVASTGLTDDRSHPKTWNALSRLRTPKVILTAGHLTNSADANRLGDSGFRDALAGAVVVGIQRVYLNKDQDPETGSLKLSDITAAGPTF